MKVAKQSKILPLLIFCLFILSLISQGVTQPGSEKAVKGGTFVVGVSGYPKSLLLYLANEDLVLGINEYVFDSLITSSLTNFEPIAALSKKWTISKDKLTFTFYLNPDAKFSDGHQVTSEDVKFTWDTIFNPLNKTAPAQSLFEAFTSCTVINPMTVQFIAKRKGFQNLEKMTNFFVLPKHFFSKGNFNSDFHENIMGSGPYRLAEAKPGEKITLKRNSNYWGKNLPQNIGRYNFDTLVFKIVEDATVAYEMFKRGDLDYHLFRMAKMWTTETDGPLYQSQHVIKLKGESQFPGSFTGIAWNLRKPLFQDKNVRKALSHLLNLKKLLKDLFYDNYVPVTGIVAPSSEYHSAKILPTPYDPGKAQELLKKAGWFLLDSDGILMKNGRKFQFELILDNPALQRVFTLYQEDLKKMGIKMDIRVLEWATSLKLKDDRQFDAMAFAFTRDVNPANFSSMWGSKEADIKGSANFTGFKDAEVDKLCAQIDATFDKKKRILFVQKLDALIGDAQPVTYTYELPYFRVAYWNKYSFPKAYLNYSIWRNAFDYWWLDVKKEKKLLARTR